MATNPMKRREQNAFLIGFIIALLIMAVVVFFVFTQYKKTKDLYDNLERRQTEVIVAGETIESGTTLDENLFTTASVITEMDTEDYFTSVDDILGDPVIYEDTKGNPEDEDKPEGEEKEPNVEYAVASRIQIPKGTIITKNMLMKTDDVLTDDVRIQEYSQIVLPSQLKNGDFIDVRLAMPDGQDFIVLSKKETIQTDETTVWLRVNELELLLLNSAMVDAWTIEGAKLYAVEYVDPGMQLGSSITYQPSAAVSELINSNPNIVKEAKNGLVAALNETRGGKKMSEYRDYINEAFDLNKEDSASAVESGFTTDIQNIQTHRSDYVKELEGTKYIGNQEETAE